VLPSLGWHRGVLDALLCDIWSEPTKRPKKIAIGKAFKNFDAFP
jgi:hypothetical protein